MGGSLATAAALPERPAPKLGEAGSAVKVHRNLTGDQEPCGILPMNGVGYPAAGAGPTALMRGLPVVKEANMRWLL